MRFNFISWILRIVAAAILLQTLYFKFTAAPESIYIFSTLGIEPYGRWGSGIVELIASFLILCPKTTYLGALLGCVVMIEAIFAHLFLIGINVLNDGGLLFGLSLITFFCCASLVYQNKNRILNLL